MHHSYCWVSTPGSTVLKCSSNCSFTGRDMKTTTSPRIQRLSNEVRRTPRRTRSTYKSPGNWNIQSSVEGSESLHLPIVTVPDEHHMLTPGEVRQVELDYPLFQQILTEGTTEFGCVNINECKENPKFGATGVILSILAVRKVVADETEGADPKVLVECRCSGRCGVMIPDISESSTLQSSRIFKTECTTIHDWLCEEFNDRRQLAEVEWRTWIACTQTAALMRKLETPGVRAVAVEQELAVWAPKPYDKDIATHEWEQTPNVTRNLWCQRAEAFSFGVLRCLQCDEDIMIRARSLTSTVMRLELALEAADKRKAMTTARLSLKNALN